MTQPTCEPLETRNLLSGSSVYTIWGGTTPTDTLHVHMKSDGIHWNINGGETHVRDYNKKLRKVEIHAGFFQGRKTNGNHRVHLVVDNKVPDVEVEVLGTQRSINHLNAKIHDPGVEVTLVGGTKSHNKMLATNHTKRGATTIIGGDWSTNEITFAGRFTTVIGGDYSKNVFSMNRMGPQSRGDISAGDESENILRTNDGKWPRNFKRWGEIKVE